MSDPADIDAAAPDTAPLPIVGGLEGLPAAEPGSGLDDAADAGGDGRSAPSGPTVRTRRRPAGPGVSPDGGIRRSRNGRNPAARRTGGAEPAAAPAAVTELEVADLFADVGDDPLPAAQPAEPAPSGPTRPGRRRTLPAGGPPAGGSPTGARTAAPEPLEVELVGTPARGRGRSAAGTIGVPSRAQVAAARRLQARKVTRLVRHIDLWSLCKISIIFYLCMLVVGTVAGTIVWSGLQRSGAVSNVEGFIESVFLVEDFQFEGPDMFRIGVLGGLVGVVVMTLLTVLGGMLFNLISDLVGGVRVSVVELETARPAPPRRRR